MFPYGYNGNQYYKSYAKKKSKRKIIIFAVVFLVALIAVTAFILKIVFFSDTNKKGVKTVNLDDTEFDSDNYFGDENGEDNENNEGWKNIIMPDPVKVKGLYVSNWTAGNPARLEHFIGLCDATELNALVIDVKDDEGHLSFMSDIVHNSKAETNILKNPEELVSTLREHNIYSIARIVCFKDPIRSAEHPEHAIKNTNGNLWKDTNGNTWLNPYNQGAWDYLVSVAKEAAKLGFDEVQFDYVRFPTDGNIKEIDYGDIIYEKDKTEAIGEFLDYARKNLRQDKIYVSADVFGIIPVSQVDSMTIGQDLEIMAKSADSLCPMIYPSHYANKRQNGEGQVINGKLFEAPDRQPYEVIYNTLMLIKYRTDYIKDSAVIRPYLQDFTAYYLGAGYYLEYTSTQVREQIQAVYDAGFEEWILWNASNVYSEGAFR